MIIKIVLILFIFPISAHALTYHFSKGDELGSVLISLGYKQLWSGKKAINRFKHRLKQKKLSRLKTGLELFIEESEILFKDNVLIENDQIKIIKKITTLKEWEELYNLNHKPMVITKNETLPPLAIELKDNIEMTLIKNDFIELTGSEFNLYLGAGTFIDQDLERNININTSTITGLQPMLITKAIFSQSKLGTLSTELLLKKIITSSFNFPINFDYRIQVLPLFLSYSGINAALSYSSINHSYVGKSAVVESKYLLTSQFLGVGLVYPANDFWLELYFEKSISGKASSTSQLLNINEGFRIDSEIVYPVYNHWFLIPGINYYQNKSNVYELKAFEARLNISREFEWSFD